MKPTEEAEMWLNLVKFPTINPADDPRWTTLAMNVHHLAKGLKFMSTGLRATYLKLEEIEKLLKGRGTAP